MCTWCAVLLCLVVFLTLLAILPSFFHLSNVYTASSFLPLPPSPPPPMLGVACFARLDEMCSCLQSMQVQLQRMWDGKGAKLDQIVQLRKYEYDSNQVNT